MQLVMFKIKNITAAVLTSNNTAYWCFIKFCVGANLIPGISSNQNPNNGVKYWLHLFLLWPYFCCDY